MFNRKLFNAVTFSALTLLSAVSNASVIKFDVNQIDSTLTQAGWTSVSLANVGDVAFTAVGGAVLYDRDRGTQNTNGPGGDVANNNMWRDFIFADMRGANSHTTDSGMNINIANLFGASTYRVTLWAFDELSNNRNMTWNGNFLTIPASPDPQSLASQSVTFLAKTDGLGNLLLQGRSIAPLDDCCNVFVNGFSVEAVPAPTTWSLLLSALLGWGLTVRKRRQC